MTDRRGLTLLEVLFASALLALLAAAVTPLLLNVRQSLEVQPSPPLHGALQELADTFFSDPAVFGIDDMHHLDRIELTWAETPQREPITVRRLAAQDEPTSHVWFAFESGDSFVLRRVAAAQEKDEPS